MVASAPGILIVLPCDPKAPRGNATTAQRIAGHLRAAGHRCRLACPDGARRARRAGLVLALHAVKCGPLAAQLARRWSVPYAILFTGTDLYGRIPAAARAAAQGAAALVALGRAAAAAGRRAYRLPADRITVIPQAALPLPRTRQRPSALRALQGSTELVLVPTGIRAVKDPRRAVAALAPLAAQRPQLRLWVAGPALDARYARRLQADLRRHTFARWLGAVPRARFLPYYRAARVILSTSRAEGGPPNALLEAAPAGRPALASDIPAHREFPGAPALFRTDAELRRKLRQLLDDPGAASRLAQQQRRRARARFSLQQEARGWRSLVRRAASQVPVTASGTGSRRRRR